MNGCDATFQKGINASREVVVGEGGMELMKNCVKIRVNDIVQCCRVTHGVRAWVRSGRGGGSNSKRRENQRVSCGRNRHVHVTLAAAITEGCEVGNIDLDCGGWWCRGVAGSGCLDLLRDIVILWCNIFDLISSSLPACWGNSFLAGRVLRTASVSDHM